MADSLYNIGSAVSGVLSGLGSVAAATTNKKIAKWSIAAQKEENDKTRAFNSAEAAIARQFSADQANLQYSRVLEQNEYNSPAQQIKRLKEAGLNPNLAYGDLSSGMQMSGGTAATGTAASSNGSVSPVNADLSGYAGLGHGLLNSFRQMAEIKNIEASTAKIQAETEGQNIENEYTPLLHKNTLKLGGAEYNLKDAQKVYYLKNSDLLHEEMTLVQNQAKLFGAQGLRLENENAYIFGDGTETEQLKLWRQSVLAPFRQQIAQADISEREAASYFMVLASQLAINAANARDANSRAALNEQQNELLTYVYYLRGEESDYGNWMREQQQNLVNAGNEQIKNLEVTNENIGLQNKWFDKDKQFERFKWTGDKLLEIYKSFLNLAGAAIGAAAKAK